MNVPTNFFPLPITGMLSTRLAVIATWGTRFRLPAFSAVMLDAGTVLVYSGSGWFIRQSAAEGATLLPKSGLPDIEESTAIVAPASLGTNRHGVSDENGT